MNWRAIPEEDRRGIFSFLFLTFALTLFSAGLMVVQGGSIEIHPGSGTEFLIMGMMFIPGFAAFVVRKFITQEGLGDAGIRCGESRRYLTVYLLIPGLFVIVYVLTALFVMPPDFTLERFMQKFGLTIGMPRWQIIFALAFGSLFFAPVINGLFAFGEEFGWRGYFLQKLLPLGARRAIIISSAVWGLWYIPFVLLGMYYPGTPVLGAAAFFVFITLLGIYIGYLRLASGSTILASFAHGIVNSQFFGVWMVLFPDVNPLLGGITGLPGIAVFALLAIHVLRKC